MREIIPGTMLDKKQEKELLAARVRIARMDEHDGGALCDPGTIMSALAYGIDSGNRDGLFDAYVMLEQAREIEAANNGWLK